MKIIIFSAPRTGTHFITRSISKTLNLPWDIDVAIGPGTQIIPEQYVMATHTLFSNSIKERCELENIKYLSIYRNVLDHALSYTRSEIDPNTQLFIDWLKNGELMFARNGSMFAVEESNIVNYDILANPDSSLYNQEKEKLKDMLEFSGEIKLESRLETVSGQWSSTWISKAPGYWSEYISPWQYEKIISDATILDMYPDITNSLP